jgi:3-oxoadipate enol-lactonase
VHRFSYAFIDLRGYGWSRALAGDHTAEEAASDIIAVADHLGICQYTISATP